ncbi:MAG: phosphotransferase [Leptospirales bacterium]|nr:phosphotransferase [Leptospirales bacterium]
MKEVQHFLESQGLGIVARVVPLQGDLSKRTYFRVEFDRPWNGHPSLILCIHPDLADPAIADFKAVAAILSSHGIAASNVMREFPERGWLLETDVGAEDLQTFVSRRLAADRSDVLATYRDVVRLAAAFHAASPEAPVSLRKFDAEKLSWELNYLMENLERFSVKAGFNYFVSFELKMFLKSLCERLERAEPQVMVHRDLHSKNVFIRNGVWSLIDFQDSRMGLPWYDLASLVYDPYLPLDRSFRLQIMEEYLAASQRRYSENLFYMQALQRTLKAIGTYCAVLSSRSDSQYLQALKQAVEYLEEIIQLGGFPDHTFLFCNSLRRAVGELSF